MQRAWSGQFPSISGFKHHPTTFCQAETGKVIYAEYHSGPGEDNGLSWSGFDTWSPVKMLWEDSSKAVMAGKLKANKEIILSGSDEWLSWGMRKRKASRVTTKFLLWETQAPGWMVMPFTKTRNTEGTICLNYEAMRSIHQSDALVDTYRKTQSQMVETIRVCSISYYKCRERVLSELVISEAQQIYQRPRLFQLYTVLLSVPISPTHLCEQDGPAAPGVTPSHTGLVP